MPAYVLDLRAATSHFPGIGRYAFNLARAMGGLLTSEERLVLLHDSRAKSPWTVAELASEQIQVVDANVPAFSIRQQWTVPRLLRTCGAALYHSVYYVMPYCCGVPCVLSIADLIPLRHIERTPRRLRVAFRWLVRMAIGTATRIIAPSECSRRDIVDQFPKAAGRTVTIPLAADPLWRKLRQQRLTEARPRAGHRRAECRRA